MPHAVQPLQLYGSGVLYVMTTNFGLHSAMLTELRTGLSPCFQASGSYGAKQVPIALHKLLMSQHLPEGAWLVA